MARTKAGTTKTAPSKKEPAKPSRKREEVKEIEKKVEKKGKKAETKGEKKRSNAAEDMASKAPAFSYDDETMEPVFEAMSFVAVRCDDAERFYVGQLLDDTVEEMFDDFQAQVNIVYYEKQQDGSYAIGNRDLVPVRAIMCEIDLIEASDGSFSIPSKYVEKIERVLSAVDAGEPVLDEDAQPIKKRKIGNKAKPVPITIPKQGDKPRKIATPKRSPVPKKSPSSKGAKINKKSGLPECIAHVTEDVVDYEMSGTHKFRSKATDVLASSKEVIRAVLTKNYDLLTKLTQENSPLAKYIHTLHATRSAGIVKTALQYAVELGDVKAVGLLAAASTRENTTTYAKNPICALQSLDTGKHTSSFSDYNRRALNASRGGKEGLNALLKDQTTIEMYNFRFGRQIVNNPIQDTIWTSPGTTYEILSIFYPGDSWVDRSEYVFPKVVRCGNVELTKKMLAILIARSGWGFNNLHLQVLGTTALDPYRKVSILKKANGHAIAPLHLAAINPFVEHLEKLVRDLDSSDIEYADKGGWHASHYAAVCATPDAMRVLIDASININAKTNQKETPLYLAASFGRLETVKLLLQRVASEEVSTFVNTPASHGKRPLHAAASNGHADVIEVLLAAGAIISLTTTDKRSALSFAAEQGHLSCVQTLIKNGADVNTSDKPQRSPLMYAVMNGHASIAKELLNANANANATDSSLNTVMHYAASYGWLSCVSLLMSTGAEAWSRNAWGYSPMACAALKSRYDVSRFLIERANEQVLDFQDASGATMLFRQCELADTIDEIDFLLTKGASPNVATVEHCFPIQQILLRLEKEPENEAILLDILKRLLKSKAYVSHADMRHIGQPLVLAMKANSHTAFDLLLPGTDLKSIGPNGEDIWMAAIDYDASYLEALLKLPSNHISATLDNNKSNILHYIAKAPELRRTPVSVVQAIVNQLENRESAFTVVNDQGDTPLLLLLRTERPLNQVFADKEQTIELDYAKLDEDFIATTEIYLKNTPQFESMVCAGAIVDGKRIASTETILHIAASRKLNEDENTQHLKWHGESIVSIVVKFGQWECDQINALDSATNKTPLLLATENNHTSGVKALVEKKADVNFISYSLTKKEEAENTPLNAAVKNANVKTTKLLLENGANASFPLGSSRTTPLHVAMMNNYGAITEALVKFGADIKAKNADGLSPLSATILRNLSVDKAEMHAGEVEYGDRDHSLCKDDWDFLCRSNSTNSNGVKSIAENQLSSITALLSNPSAADAIGVQDNNGRTCLHYACRNRDSHLLRALLHLSTSAINQPDKCARTPLHFAVNAALMTPEATFDIESLLLQNGADVNAVDEFGYTVLHFAFSKVNLDWHIENKNLSAEEQYKKHRAHLAYIPSNETDPIETVGNLCLVKGLDVNKQDILGRTSLHIGAATGAIVSVLSILRISPKSVLEIEDNRGDTALGRATAHNRKAMVTTLIQEGANIHGKLIPLKQKTKVSYYYYAVQNAWQGICHLLLNSGYCRRQAVEDSIRTHNFQLTLNLVTGLLNSTENTLLELNQQDETLLHVLMQQDAPFEGLVRTIAWMLIDAGVRVDALTKAGLSALHFASQNGNLQAMRFILHLAPRLLNMVSLQQETPAHYGLKHAASVDIALRSLVFFLRKQAIVHSQDSSGFSLLSILIDRFADATDLDSVMFLHLVERLLVAKVSPNGLFRTQLRVSCSPLSTKEHLPRLSLLMRTMYLKSGYLRQNLLAILLYYNTDTAEFDDECNTCLMHAVVNNLLDEIKLLLAPSITAYQFDPTTKKANLLERSIDPVKLQVLSKATNVFGQNALHLAVNPLANSSYENVEIVRHLLERGVPADGLDKKRKTPIDLAKLQPSGVLYEALTKKALETPSVSIHYPAKPPVEADASAFLEAAEANGHVKEIAIAPEVHRLCSAGNRPVVYVDDNGVAYSILMTKVDVLSGQHGVNVFYRMQVVYNSVQDVYVLFTNWGRIGEDGKYQHTPFNDAASATDEFKKIFKSKSGNAFPLEDDSFEKKPGKYMLFSSRKARKEYDETITSRLHSEINKKAASSSLSEPIQTVLKVVADLKCLEDAAKDHQHNTTDLPIVELQPKVLSKALDELAIIKKMIEDNETLQQRMNSNEVKEAEEIASLADAWRSATENIAEKSSRYFEKVPRSDAANETPLAALTTITSVNEEITRLRSLLEIAETSKIILAAKHNIHKVNPLDYCYNALQISLRPCFSAEFDAITKYFNQGIKDEKKYKVSQVFALNRKGESERTHEVPGHTTLLWHGTRKTNLMGILSRGLRIAPPEAPVSGYAFGKGVYFADVSAKSLNYCGSPYSITEEKQVHYMLLCDVALGSMHKVISSEYREVAADGTHSTFAQGLHRPDPRQTVVLNEMKYKMPLGQIVQIGRDIPFDFAWYAKHPNPTEDMCYWNNIDRKLSSQAQQKLEALVLSDEKQLILTDKMHEFHIYTRNYLTIQSITIDVKEKTYWISKRLGSAELVVTVKADLSGEDATYSYSVIGQAEVFESTPAPLGYTLHTGQFDLSYDEFIVYNEAQVQMRYLVEIECL